MASKSPIRTHSTGAQHQPLSSASLNTPSVIRAPPTKAAAPLSQEAQQAFDAAYEGALRKKQVFKAYMESHGVMEAMNAAVTALFEAPALPEDPLQFLSQQLLSASHSSTQQQSQRQ